MPFASRGVARLWTVEVSPKAGGISGLPPVAQRSKSIRVRGGQAKSASISAWEMFSEAVAAAGSSGAGPVSARP